MDPISLFPPFKRPEGTGGTNDPVPVVPFVVTLAAEPPIVATVPTETVHVVVLDEDFNVCAYSVRSS